MIGTESFIDLLHSWRRDKMAMTVLVGLMGGDSISEAWVRLDDVMPTLQEMETGSRKNRGRSKEPRLDLDHDLCKRVLEHAREVEPWLRQLAETETAT